MKKALSLVAAVTLSATLFSVAQEEEETQGVGDAPPLKIGQIAPRSASTGWNMALFGGANFFQFGSAEMTVGGTDYGSSDVKSQVNYTGGTRFGYTWSGFDMGNDANYSDEVRMFPSLYGEFMYMGFDKLENTYDTQRTATGGSFTPTSRFSVNAWTFSLLPVLNWQVGSFRPYIGVGAGVAYLDTNDITVDFNGGRNSWSNWPDGDIAFVGQVFAGSEFFIVHNVSLFAEYKFVYLTGFNFGYIDGPNYTYKNNGIGSNVINMGVKFYF